MDNGLRWKQYSDPSGSFFIRYPSMTHPEMLRDKEPGLVSRIAFGFEQPFHISEDVGSMRLRFQISVWKNSNQLAAEGWAKQDANPQLPSTTRSIEVGGREGVILYTSNLAWPIVKIFVAYNDCIYELRYTDISAMERLPRETRSYWADVFSRMVGSLRLGDENPTGHNNEH